MHRVQWFKVEWNKHYHKVIDGIVSRQYNDNISYGFKLYKRREKFLEASYITKRENEETIENPFTNEVTIYSKIVYEQTKFILESNSLGIELINPPRSVQKLLNNFASISNFNITINQLNLNLIVLIESLKIEFDEFKINMLECKDIHLQHNTTVKVIAKNDLLDVSQDLKGFLLDKEYTVEKMKCTFVINKIKSHFEFTNKGQLKTNKKNIELLVPIIKKNILSSL